MQDFQNPVSGILGDEIQIGHAIGLGVYFFGFRIVLQLVKFT